VKRGQKQKGKEIETEEQRDKENRRNNVILYSVVENNGGRAEDRNKDDAAFSLCHGHNSYAKSGRLYLQMMVQLSKKYPLVHEQLSNGFHAVRRSDRY